MDLQSYKTSRSKVPPDDGFPNLLGCKKNEREKPKIFAFLCHQNGAESQVITDALVGGETEKERRLMFG